MTSFELMMPFYGDVNYFKEAVNSVLLQSNPNWRLTILDDNYPSNEPKKFISDLGDPRISYRRNATNLGISRNFQAAVDLITADYVTIIGCDDVLLPNYVEVIFDAISTFPSATYLQPGVKVIDTDGRSFFPLGDRVKQILRMLTHGANPLSGENLARSLLSGNWTYFPSIAWKSTALRELGFRNDFRIVLDLALQFEIIFQNGSLAKVSEPAFMYRRHRRSASMDAARDSTRFDEEARLFDEIEVGCRLKNWNKAAASARWHITSRINAFLEGIANILSGNFRFASKAFNHAFRS